ncbi:MAG: DUF3795 domain-containing protein [Candidatus Bathyarchaeota archaeon]|nr:MAG: DUF3795 domain-containing protein [Candidatus Bathyarchaeota archaeon]
MTTTNSADFVGHCGLYCNACGIRQEKIKDAANNLQGLITYYGFDKVMPDLVKYEPSLKNYDKFAEVLDGLVNLFGDCPGCMHEGGDPGCKVRACAKQKGYRTCAECKEIKTCENLAPYRQGYKGLVPALKNIRKNGIESYAKEMQQKVDKGFSYLEEPK